MWSSEVWNIEDFLLLTDYFQIFSHLFVEKCLYHIFDPVCIFMGFEGMQLSLWQMNFSSRLASSSDPRATGNFSAVALVIQWSLIGFQ